MAGAPKGNQNAKGRKQKLFDDALRRAIAQDDKDRLRTAAESLLTQAASGEQWAIKELADRMDGKPVQSVDLDANVTVSHEEWLKTLS
jgi:hypothetical protein